jgi:hypothetical protein
MKISLAAYITDGKPWAGHRAPAALVLPGQLIDVKIIGMAKVKHVDLLADCVGANS